MWTNNHFFLKLCQPKNWTILTLFCFYLFSISASNSHQIHRRQTADDILSEGSFISAQYPENRPINKQETPVIELQNAVKDPTVVGELQNNARITNSYPDLTSVVQTNFTCRGLKGQGWYADVETGCQQYHRCYSEIRGTSFICPPGTLFSQDTLICDYWYNVNCSASLELYEYANSRLYKLGVPLHGNGTYASPPPTEAPPRVQRVTFTPRPVVTQRINVVPVRPIVQPGRNFVTQAPPAAFVRPVFTPAPFRIAPSPSVQIIQQPIQPVIFTPPATSPQQLTQNGFILPGASGRVFEFDDSPEGLTNASSMVSSALAQNYTVGQTDLNNGVRIIIIAIPTIVYINGTIPISQAGNGSIAVGQINQRFTASQIAMLESQAVSGITYPNFTASIRTDFTCGNLPRSAWYEELQTNCQQYYYCDENGTLTTFLCPATNVFSQATLRCEAWYNAVCGARPVVGSTVGISVSGSASSQSSNNGFSSTNFNSNSNTANVGPVIVTGVVSQNGQDLSRSSQAISQADLTNANDDNTETETSAPVQFTRPPGPVVILTPNRNGFVQASQQSGPVVTAAPRPVFVPQQRPILRVTPPTTRRTTPTTTTTTTTTDTPEVLVEEEEVTDAPTVATTRRTTPRRRNVIASIPLTSVFVGGNANANRSNAVTSNNSTAQVVLVPVAPVAFIPVATTTRRTIPTTTTSTTTTEAPTTPAPILVPVILIQSSEAPAETIEVTEVPILAVPETETTLVPIIASLNSITNQSAVLQQLLNNTSAGTEESGTVTLNGNETNGTNIAVISTQPGSHVQVGANGVAPLTVLGPNGQPSQSVNQTLAAGESASVDIPANVQNVTLVLANNNGTNTTVNLNTEDGTQEVVEEETTTTSPVVVPLIVPVVQVTQITPRPIGQVSPRIIVGNVGLLAGTSTTRAPVPTTTVSGNRARVTWWQPQVVGGGTTRTTRRVPVAIAALVVPLVPSTTTTTTARPTTTPTTTTMTTTTTPTTTTTTEEETTEVIEVVPVVPIVPVVASGGVNGTVVAGSAVVHVTSFDVNNNGSGLILNNNISSDVDIASQAQSGDINPDDILVMQTANQNGFIPVPILVGGVPIVNNASNQGGVLAAQAAINQRVNGHGSTVLIVPQNNATIFVGGATSLNSNFNSNTGQTSFSSSAVAVSSNNGVTATTRTTVPPSTARRGKVTWWVPSVVGGVATTRARPVTQSTGVPSVLIVPIAVNSATQVPTTTTTTTRRTTPTTTTTTTTTPRTVPSTTVAPVVVPMVQVVPVNVVQVPSTTDENAETSGQSATIIPLFGQEQGALVGFGQSGTGASRPAAIVVASSSAQTGSQSSGSAVSGGQSMVPLFGQEQGALVGFGASSGASSTGSLQRTTLTNASLEGLKTPPMVATILLPEPVFSETNLLPLPADGILTASQTTTPASGGNATELGAIIGTRKYLEHRLIVRIGPFRDSGNATAVLSNNVTVASVVSSTEAPSVPRQFRQLRRLH